MCYNETSERTKMKLPKFDLSNIDKKAVTKAAIGIVVSAGVSKIITGIIETNVDSVNAKDRLAVAAAKVAITGILVVACKKYTDNLVDSAIEGYQTIAAGIEEATTLEDI
jgi:hypothetical protein